LFSGIQVSFKDIKSESKVALKFGDRRNKKGLKMEVEAFNIEIQMLILPPGCNNFSFPFGSVNTYPEAG
jgi:hypothetical protein